MSRDGHQIFCRQWLCNEPAKARANVLIAHGMGEHSARYGELAHALNAAGFNVIAPDLRGHGHSLPALIEPGDMGRNGWQKTLADLAFLEYRMTQEYDRPAILFGHSMGAMLAQEYAYTLGHRLHAMILSGSPGVFPRVPALLLSSLARFDSWRLTPASPSPLISKNLFRSNLPLNATLSCPVSTKYIYMKTIPVLHTRVPSYPFRYSNFNFQINLPAPLALSISLNAFPSD